MNNRDKVEQRLLLYDTWQQHQKTHHNKKIEGRWQGIDSVHKRQKTNTLSPSLSISLALRIGTAAGQSFDADRSGRKREWWLRGSIQGVQSTQAQGNTVMCRNGDSSQDTPSYCVALSDLTKMRARPDPVHTRV